MRFHNGGFDVVSFEKANCGRESLIALRKEFKDEKTLLIFGVWECGES